LLDTTLAAWGATEVKVDLEPTGVSLPPDHATSVAIVLLERLQARLQDASPATLKVGLRAVAQEARLTVTETGVEAGRISELRPYLVEAMVEQLGGRYSCKADADGVVTELAFPMATVGGTAPAPTLH
jgi:two-component sensor histidine kinase